MGSFPKCDSSGTALDSGLLASGPGSLAAGEVCGQATVQLQGDTLRSSCLWQIHPSSLHLSGCTGLNKVLGEDQHSPFSEPEHHILTLLVWVQWLDGWGAAQGGCGVGPEQKRWWSGPIASPWVLIPTETHISVRWEGIFLIYFGGFSFQRRCWPGACGRVECLLGLSLCW